MHAEQERPPLAIAARRRAWFAAQPNLDSQRLVFIDETGASTKMARLRGRALRGDRCRAAVPRGHWKTTTFTGALRVDGMTAPRVLDGPMNHVAFQSYIEQAGATLRYLPPYSPDFNPIENAFSKLKVFLGKAAARTIDDLWDVIRDALPRASPQDCANHFTAAGYELEHHPTKQNHRSDKDAR